MHHDWRGGRRARPGAEEAAALQFRTPVAAVARRNNRLDQSIALQRSKDCSVARNQVLAGSPPTSPRKPVAVTIDWDRVIAKIAVVEECRD